MPEIHYLGIDFGSCSTALMGVSIGQNDTPTFHPLGKSEDNYCFDTVLFCKPDGTALIGAAARAYRGEGQFYHSPKETILNSEKDNEGKQVIFLYLSKIFDELDASYTFTDLRGVCFGHPNYHQAETTADYNDTMVQALTELFYTRYKVRPIITPATEPILAAIAYVQHNPDYNSKNEKKPFIVVDCGGHTIDFSFTAVNTEAKCGGDIPLLAPSTPFSFSGDECPAVGMFITEVICHRISEVEGIHPAFTYDDTVEAAKREFFSSFIAKAESYTSDSAHEVHLRHSDKTPFKRDYTIKFRYGKKDDQESTISLLDIFWINAAFAFIGSLIQKYIEFWCKKPEHIPSRILFVGGASRMTPLQAEIQTAIKNSLTALLEDFALEKEAHEALALQIKQIPADCIRTDAPACTGRPALTHENAVAYGAAFTAWHRHLYDEKAEITVSHDRELANLQSVEGNTISYKRRLIGLRQRLMDVTDYDSIGAIIAELRTLLEMLKK